MKRKFTSGRVTFTAAEGMVLSEGDGEPGETFTDQQLEVMDTVASSVKVYVQTSKELLNGRLSHLREWAPPHLAHPGNTLVACCADGVVIRYEPRTESETRFFLGWLPYALPEAVSLLSQRLVHLRANRDDEPPEEASGVTLSLQTGDRSSGRTTEVLSARVFFDVSLPPVDQEMTGPVPFRLFSVQNGLELEMLGELLPTDDAGGSSTPFLVRSAIRLPVGWEALEVFPGLYTDGWTEASAVARAEKDILAAVVSKQWNESRLVSLDPNAAAREQIARLLGEYEALLESEPQEQQLQDFLTAHPQLLCPSHARTWPELQIGAHVTDFVFQEAAGDYLLVELEKPSDSLFNAKGHPAHKLTHARGQLQDWRRYLEDNLSTVQRELGLHGISANPRGVVVIGRSRDLTAANRRKLIAIENESPRVRILTYDDLALNARAVAENILGPLWNVQGGTRVFYPPRG